MIIKETSISVSINKNAKGHDTSDLFKIFDHLRNLGFGFEK